MPILPEPHRDTVSVATRRRVRDMIAERASEGATQLPPEEDLAERLGVSRATLRSALLSLQTEGLIRREHGRGTFIQGRAAGLAANLGRDRAFLDVIRDAGHEAGARARIVGPVDSGGQVAGPALSIERIFTSDGRPAVAAFDLVPLARLRAPWQEVEPEDSVFSFCAAWCGRPISYSIAEIVPVAADRAIAECLELAGGTPLILLDHLHVSGADEPAAATRAYLDDRLLRFSVVRAGGGA